jgi:hypothetical protein
MHAQIGHDTWRAARSTPDHERLAEQVSVDGAVGHLAGESDRVPARALGGQVREHSR